MRLETEKQLEKEKLPKAVGLLIAVGIKKGKKSRVWCESIEGEIPAETLRRLETALAKQRVALEKEPDNAVAHFNAGCFAARAGRADEAIEYLRRAVEMNARIKELIATDDDLESIREDQRFAELTK